MTWERLQSNTRSIPPPGGDSVASLTADEATPTLPGCQISPHLAQNQRPVVPMKSRAPDLKGRPNQRNPVAVGPWLADSLQDRWQRYQEQFRRCRRRFSEESIHELRVAARRLMALFTLLSCVPGGAVGENGRRMLKRQLKALNELRDTQVQRRFLAQQVPRFPELLLVHDLLEREECRLARTVATAPDRFRTRKLEEWVMSLRAEFNRQPADRRRQTQLLGAVVRGTTRAFAEVVARREAIDPTDPDTIHRTRVAFKRFRLEWLRHHSAVLSPGCRTAAK